jgi:hypothetical protein
MVRLRDGLSGATRSWERRHTSGSARQEGRVAWRRGGRKPCAPTEPPPTRAPRWAVWPATCVPVGQGRTPAATDLPRREPLASPQVTSGHVMMAAATGVVTMRAWPPPNLVPLIGYLRRHGHEVDGPGFVWWPVVEPH